MNEIQNKKLDTDSNQPTSEKPPSSLKRRIRRLCARLLSVIFAPVERKDQFEGQLKSVLIIAQEKLGDAILLTPLIANLRRALPGIKIHIIALSSISSFFENDPNIDVVHKPKQNYYYYWRKVSKYRFDVLFSPKDHPSFNFLMHARFVKARFKVGIDHPEHRPFFQHLLTIDFYSHVIRKNCALLDYLGISYTEENCRPYLPKDDVSEKIAAFIKTIPLTAIMGINLSAGEATREWPITKWKALIAAIDSPILILAMSDKEEVKIQLENEFPQVIASPPTQSIYEAGRLIQHMRLLVSPDTSLIHVASCYRTAVVGLYRRDPVHHFRFYPYNVPHVKLISKTIKIADISVNRVIEAVQRFLTEKKPSST